MKNIIIISLCLLSGVFSQAQTVAIGTTAKRHDSNQYALSSTTHSTGVSRNVIVAQNTHSFENITTTLIQKSNVQPSGSNRFVRMSKWISLKYQEMRANVNQWLYLEMNEDSYGWGAY